MTTSSTTTVTQRHDLQQQIERERSKEQQCGTNETHYGGAQQQIATFMMTMVTMGLGPGVDEPPLAGLRTFSVDKQIRGPLHL